MTRVISTITHQIQRRQITAGQDQHQAPYDARHNERKTKINEVKNQLIRREQKTATTKISQKLTVIVVAKFKISQSLTKSSGSQPLRPSDNVVLVKIRLKLHCTNASGKIP